MIKFMLRAVIFTVVVLIVGEIFFRTVIPASQNPYAKHEEKFKTMMFDTTAQRDGVYTSGKFAAIRAHWHVNNYGFLADVDYYPPEKKDKPRIVIIGDSFIVGMIIEWKDHVVNQLNKYLGFDNYDVYSLGSDTGTLIQYYHVANFAVEKFDPDIIIFVLNRGDIKSGLLNYDRSFMHNVKLEYKDGELSEVWDHLYQPSKVLRFFRHSALARYLWINRKLTFMLKGMVDSNANPGQILDPDVSEEDEKVFQMASDYCIKKLAEEHPDRKMVYVFDAYRYHMYHYDGKPEMLPVSRYVQNSCKKYGGYCLDLTDAFYNDYQKNHIWFNWEHDFHWNPYAHNLVAHSIYDFLIKNNLVNVQPDQLTETSKDTSKTSQSN